MKKTENTSTSNNNVEWNTVYTEMHNEMRDFRNNIFTLSTWYTALLIAILAFVISIRFSTVIPQSRLTVLLIHSCCMKMFLAVLTLVIVMSSCYMIYYAYRRYYHLKYL